MEHATHCGCVGPMIEENAKLRAEVERFKLALEHNEMIRQDEKRTALLQVEEARKFVEAYGHIEGHSPNCACLICEAWEGARASLQGLSDKPLQEPSKCDSYWDGNQCEALQGHDGKHWFMGWTWVVSPPPLTEDAEKRKCESVTGSDGRICCTLPHGHSGFHMDGKLIEWTP